MHIVTLPNKPLSAVPRPPQRRGRTLRLWALVLFMAAAVMGLIHAANGQAAADSPVIKAGLSGYCLDDHRGSTAPGNPVEEWGCNGSRAQAWDVSDTTISFADNYCLSVLNNRTATGTPVVLERCDSSPGQVWLRDQNGFENPNSGLCLSGPDKQATGPVYAADCHQLAAAVETWTPSGTAATGMAACQTGTEGQRVACKAIQQWNIWQSGTPSHETLLNQYTDGTPYEEWCADFVSYIYKAAGYPFTDGETDGWDQNIANDVQYMGFRWHAAAGYTPQPGDVAYFNYNGGHVEIVVSGSKTPTFVYGNSATIDPTTGNGQMKANTITNDGSLGHVIYYLSPT